jgi:hypothetical protein
MSANPPKKEKPGVKSNQQGRVRLEPMAEISIERGVACNAVLTLRLPDELKKKLRQVPNWQDEVRKALAAIAGY